MNRKQNTVVNVWDLVWLIVAAVVHYFTKNRMGMMRHVMYKNQFFESTIFNPLGKGILLAVLFLALILALNNFRKKGHKVTLIFSILLLILALTFTIFANTKLILAYYYILIAISAIALGELIRQLILTFTSNRRD